MKQRFGLASLTLLAAALRWYDLGRFELFADESASWWFGRLAFLGELSPEVEPTPPLYYWLLGLVMRFFGESDVVMRTPSVVVGVLTVPVIFWVGRSLLGTSSGWIAAVIVTVHPLHVFYSREARVYPLLLLASVVAVGCAWRTLNGDGKSGLTGFGCSATIACYSHFYGMFLVASLGVGMFFLARETKERQLALAAMLIPLVLFAPYVLVSIPHLEEGGSAWSIGGLYELAPEEKKLTRVLEMQLIGAHYSVFLRQIASPPTPALLRTACLGAQLIALVAVIFAFRKSRPRRLVLLLCAWFPPILIPWAITHWWRPIFHIGRHDFFTIGAVSILVGGGLGALWGPLRRQALAAACSIFLIFGSWQRLAALSSHPTGQKEQSLAEFLSHASVPGDRAIALGVRRLTTEHYARAAGVPLDFESFPASTDEHPGWADPNELERDLPALVDEAAARVAQLRAQPTSAVFVITRSSFGEHGPLLSTVDRPLLEALVAGGYHLDSRSTSEEDGVLAFRLPADSEAAG